MWPGTRPFGGRAKTGVSRSRDSPRHNATRSEMPRFIVLDLDHHKALRRNGWTRFRAVTEFVQAIDVCWCQLPAPHVEERSNHLAHHVTKERASTNCEDQLFVVCSSRQLRRKDFPLRVSFFVVFFGAG